MLMRRDYDRAIINVSPELAYLAWCQLLIRLLRTEANKRYLANSIGGKHQKFNQETAPVESYSALTDSKEKLCQIYCEICLLASRSV